MRMMERKDTMKWIITRKNGVLAFPTLPDTLESGDVMFLSASGQEKVNPYLKWHQKLWLKTDKMMRRLLVIK